MYLYSAHWLLHHLTSRIVEFRAGLLLGARHMALWYIWTIISQSPCPPKWKLQKKDILKITQVFMVHLVVSLSSNWSVSVCLCLCCKNSSYLFDNFRLTSYFLSFVFIHLLSIHAGTEKVGALRPEHTSCIGTPRAQIWSDSKNWYLLKLYYRRDGTEPPF